TAQREADEQYRQKIDLEQRVRRAGAEAARKRAAPHDAEVLLEGQHSRYWRSDFTQFTELEQETRAKIEVALAELGFVLVGDLVAKKQRDIVLRSYVSGDGQSYALLMG